MLLIGELQQDGGLRDHWYFFILVGVLIHGIIQQEYEFSINTVASQALRQLQHLLDEWILILE